MTQMDSICVICVIRGLNLPPWYALKGTRFAAIPMTHAYTESEG